MYGICRTELLKMPKQIKFLIDRFYYKLEGEQSELKIFLTIFSSLQSIEQTISFYEQTNFSHSFSQVAEQTIYFPLFAEQSFFHKKP